MPWTVSDVERHNKGLNDRQRRQWVAVANSVLSKCGGGSDCEARAIIQANGVVGRAQKRKEARESRIILDLAALKAEARDRDSSGGGRGYGARAGETIRGNLVRDSGGKFSSGNNPTSAANVKPKLRTPGIRGSVPVKPGAKPKKGAAQTEAQRQATRAQREVERQSDRKRREAERQQTRAQREQERLETRAKREAEREADKKKREETAAAKPPKGGKAPAAGGGKGGAESKREQTRERTSNEIEQRGGLTKKLSKALRDLSDGNEPDGPEMKELVGKGLARRVGDSYELTPSGRGYLGSLNSGNTRNALRSLERARRLSRRTTKAFEAPADSFAIFKDASGNHRWLLISSNAYRDKDNEIVSLASLVADCERADSDGMYGPLRWWHVGAPDPFNAEAPWGEGADLGMCDFNMVYGRWLVESGTFKSRKIGEAIYRIQDQLQASLGFLHPPNEPVIEDGIGIFKTIYRFERSLVPRGLAANPFTQLVVRRRDEMKDQKKLDLLRKLTNDGIVSGLTQRLDLQEKELEMQNIAHKEAPPTREQQIDALLLGMKALMLGSVPADETPEPEAVSTPEAPVTEEKAVGDMAAEEEMEDEEEYAPEFVSDLTIVDFAEVIKTAVAAGVAESIAPLSEGLAVSDKVGGAMAAMDELKALMGGFTRKKDAESAQQAADLESLKERAKEIDVLKAQLQTSQTQQVALEAKLKELLGEQPSAQPFVASQSDANLVGDNSANYKGFTNPQMPPANEAIDQWLTQFMLSQPGLNGQ